MSQPSLEPARGARSNCRELLHDKHGSPSEVNARPRAQKAIIELTKLRRSAPNLIAFALTFAAYASGCSLLVGSGARPLLGLLPLLLSMVLAWYLCHECAHGIAMKSRAGNAVMGEILSWINGYSYYRFSEYARDHLRHHALQVDLVGTDVRELLERIPRPFRRLVEACEAWHVPLSHALIRWDQRLSIWREGDTAYRARLVVVWLSRTALLGMLGRASLLGLVVYVIAIIARIHVVRFVDCFQHSFPEVDPNLPIRPRGREFEQQHTFSFPVAYQWTPLNLLILNFGFHNAHHAMPTCPWYNLPRIHQMLVEASSKDAQLPRAAPPRAPFRALLSAYHHYRLTRLVAHDQGQATDDQRKFSFEKFSGAFSDKLLG